MNLRLRGFVDLVTGVVLLPLVAIGLYLIVIACHDSAVELGRLVLFLRCV